MGYRIIGTVPNALYRNMKIIYLDNGAIDLPSIPLNSIAPGSEARNINTRELWILNSSKTWQQSPWNEGVIGSPVIEDVPEGANVQFVRVRDAAGTAKWDTLSSHTCENPSNEGLYVREGYYASPEDRTAGILSFRWKKHTDDPITPTAAGQFFVKKSLTDGSTEWVDAADTYIIPNMTEIEWKTAQAIGDAPEWAHIIDSTYDAFQGEI